MSWWIASAVVVLTGLLVARRWLPDRSSLSDSAYDAFRSLVPAPRPTVRVVTKRVARTCRRQRVAMPYGHKAVLPRAFLVEVSHAEYAAIEPLLDTVQEAVSASLVRTAREKQWLFAGPPRVVVQESETVTEGRPQIISTTLPSPGALGGGADALPREATSAYLAESAAARPAPADDEEAQSHDPTQSLAATRAESPTTRWADPGGVTPPSRLPGGPAGPAGPGGLGGPGGSAAPGLAEQPVRPVLVAVGRDQAAQHPAVKNLPVRSLGARSLGAEPTAAEPRPSHLHRLRGTGGEPDIVVLGEPLVVGRAEDCDVTVSYPSASRHHLRLVPTAAGCRVEDLDSRHGTRVNGSPVRTPVLLRPRDTLQLGSMGPCWTYQPLSASTPVMHSTGDAVS